MATKQVQLKTVIRTHGMNGDTFPKIDEELNGMMDEMNMKVLQALHLPNPNPGTVTVMYILVAR